MGHLAAERYGHGPLLIALHGFTQTSASWIPVGTLLAARRSILAVDLPGHGASSQTSCDLDEAAALVVDLAGAEPFDLVGYSLGGRIALHVACANPPGLRRTVAVSASPGIRDDTARRARLERDREMADALEASGDVASFLSRWLANPMFATLPAERAGVDDRSTNTPSGLADSLRRCSAGAQRWLGDELVGVVSPTFAVVGARDDPFVASARSLADTCPRIGMAVVPGAGHACHLEQPATVARLIAAHLA